MKNIIKCITKKPVTGYLLSCFCLFTFFTGDLNATIINVLTNATTIQGAVNLAAPSGDTIQIAAGTYVEQIQVVNKSLSIVGAGEDTTMIQAPSASTPLYSIFYVWS